MIAVMQMQPYGCPGAAPTMGLTDIIAQRTQRIDNAPKGSISGDLVPPFFAL
jgi:hypothetical protein